MSILDLTSKSQTEREDRAFIAHMEHFHKRWAPDDRYEASQFHSELDYIIRLVYREAQEPVFKQLNQLMMSLPIPSILASPK